jgi:acetolactate synthase-1/3 small subunit
VAAVRHIISILLENESGALSRVSGLFSARAYNIESLTVAPTDDATMSRITVVTSGDEPVIQQIIKQLNKLVDVVKVMDLTEFEHFEREVLLLKVNCSAAQSIELEDIIRRYQLRQLSVQEDTRTLEATTTSQEIDEILKAMSRFRVIEAVRSGVVGVGSNDAILKP